MCNIVIRQAVLSDLEQVAALFDSYRQFQGQPSDIAAATSFLRARFDHGESIVFLALMGGPPTRPAPEPVGFAQLYPSYSSVALSRVFVLNDLFVHETGRRRGVASRLLKAVADHAWQLGGCRVSLNAAKSNLAANAFYKAQGWQLDDVYNMFHRFPDG